MNVRTIGNSVLKHFPDKAGDAAATIALLSTTTKDLVNCIYYTNQSLTNKKIPEEKRKFVAGIDLSNGILNVLTQVTAGLWVKNKSEDWYDRLFKNTIPTDAKLAKVARGGFSLIAVLVFTQIFLKRVVTPFLATPMAHYFKEYAEKKAAKKQDGETPKQTEQPQNNKAEETKPVQGSVLNIVSEASKSKTFKGFDEMLHN